jgi:type II secretory pathway pseudopilin PulG
MKKSLENQGLSINCLNKSQRRDGGYTIIEALMAMVVVSVLMISIAPVLAFSVATRLQARRIELGTQAAKAYIDALKAGSIPYTNPTFPTKYTGTDLTDALPPTTDTNKLYCIDLDGTGSCSTTSNQDFYVQGAWRNPANTTSDPTTTGYELIVRVYRAISLDGTRTLKSEKAAGKKQSTVTSGIGNLNAPVVEMRTEIAATNTQNSSYSSLCARLQDTSTNKCQPTK